jgi:hypothetical protein
VLGCPSHDDDCRSESEQDGDIEHDNMTSTLDGIGNMDRVLGKWNQGGLLQTVPRRKRLGSQPVPCQCPQIPGKVSADFQACSRTKSGKVGENLPF